LTLPPQHGGGVNKHKKTPPQHKKKKGAEPSHAGKNQENWNHGKKKIFGSTNFTKEMPVHTHLWGVGEKRKKINTT